MFGNSDQGNLLATKTWEDLPSSQGIKVSMDGQNRCREDFWIEQSRTLKQEWFSSIPPTPWTSFPVRQAASSGSTTTGAPPVHRRTAALHVWRTQSLVTKCMSNACTYDNHINPLQNRDWKRDGLCRFGSYNPTGHRALPDFAGIREHSGKSACMLRPHNKCMTFLFWGSTVSGWQHAPHLPHKKR